jgi:AraC-like DNA-binding protein
MRLLLCVYPLCLVQPASAQATTDTTRLRVGIRYAEEPLLFRTFIDQEGRQTVGDLTATAFSDSPPKPLLMAGFTPDAIWGRFTLVAPASATPANPASYMLQLTNWHLDEADLYVPTPTGTYAVQRAGDRLPFSSRAIKTRFPAFRVTLTGSQPVTYYLRIRSTQHINLGVRLSSVVAFSDSTFSRTDISFMLGITLMRFVVQLALLLLFFRDRAFRAYSVWGMLVCVAYFTSRGNSNVLFPHSPYWANAVFLLACSLSPLALTYFVGMLYDVPTHFRRLLPVGWAIGAVCIALFIANLFGQHVYLSRAIFWVFWLVVACLARLLVVGYKRGLRPWGWYFVPLAIYGVPYTIFYVRNLLTYGQTASLLSGSLQETNIQWAFVVEFLLVPILAVMLFRKTTQTSPPAAPAAQPIPTLPAAQPTPAQQAFLDLVLQVIGQHLSDPAFDVEQLADAVAVSSRTLNRRLGTSRGVSAGGLIRRMRLQQAAQLLREGLPPMEIAYRVGFENPSSFSRAFRDEFGKTPSAFAAEQ